MQRGGQVDKGIVYGIKHRSIGEPEKRIVLLGTSIDKYSPVG